jgi:hypothetical protein
MIKELIRKENQISMLRKLYNNSKLKEMYLDYVNNFITIEKFGCYYDLEYTEALHVINLGRSIHITDTQMNEGVK